MINKNRVSLRTARSRRTGTIRNIVTMACVVTASVIVALGLTSSAQTNSASRNSREGHAVWAHPPNVGKTAESVREFVAQCKRANIDTIVMLVKGMSGEIYWKSKRFPQAIAKGYESFDVLEHLTREAHSQGIRVDAWLVDFAEGVNGSAYREHPEWAQLNADGGTTATETLGVKRRPYDYVWMCPARRPGYVDQWLLPMIEEIASTYPVDSIHHDYVRYGGDVAPDSYCFCDYCLAHIPRYALLNYETQNSERYRIKHVQERIEANWWADPTMLPVDWQKRDRREMADFLINGSTIPGGPPDMRYFFYDYRVHQIDTFVREAYERVKRIRRKSHSGSLNGRGTRSLYTPVLPRLIFTEKNYNRSTTSASESLRLRVSNRPTLRVARISCEPSARATQQSEHVLLHSRPKGNANSAPWSPQSQPTKDLGQRQRRSTGLRRQC